MHKIKELLHRDNDDSNSSSSSSSSKDNDYSSKHDHSLKKSSGDNDREVLSTTEFEQGHVHHGEIEHGHSHHHHVHTHEHLPATGEKHIIYERETMNDGGNLYQSGVDPSLNREVLSTTSHDGGVSRERVDESKIVKESIKEVELHKVQPVIHREREQKEIRHVVEPHKKVEIKDTKIHHHERDIDLGVRREASTLETSRDLGSAPNIESSREFLGKERQHQELPMKVEEHVHRRVEEHVHPVIYKEVLKPKVTEETHHIYEKVKEAPIETYEVKEISRSRGDGLREAEREFFDRESSRGIVLDEGHVCSRDCTTGGNYSREYTTTTMAQEPILIGHHQNIGGHHLAAGAVPAGHNTAYDAALCNQCTDNAICSHSTRDADRMKKMNEKKLAKDEKLAQKQMKKAEKQSKKNASTVV